jgi:hypothetical protein
MSGACCDTDRQKVLGVVLVRDNVFCVCCDTCNVLLGQYSINVRFQRAGESDSDDEISDADMYIHTYEAVGKVVAGCRFNDPCEEIAELDTIGFDETVVLDESSILSHVINNTE